MFKFLESTFFLRAGAWVGKVYIRPFTHENKCLKKGCILFVPSTFLHNTQHIIFIL